MIITLKQTIIRLLLLGLLARVGAGNQAMAQVALAGDAACGKNYFQHG